jgi:hypothetical protein
MKKYEVDFSVNGQRTKTVVVADSQEAARRLVEAQYKGSKLQFWGYKTLS